MNAVARAQLTFQMLALLQEYFTTKCNVSKYLNGKPMFMKHTVRWLSIWLDLNVVN